ncbi:universal stress protein [Streptomyces lavendulocolor]|uniref:universal stress protein n=1 Tax=Streptomyces lavendulocolor TaxID=67316 RepID=UPI0031D2BB93
MTGNVTVGFDGSPESVAATRWAAREARLRGAPLCLLHVARSPATSEVPLHRPGPPSASAATLLRQVAEEAERDHEGLVVTVEERAGRPAAELAGAVDDIGRTQLLVLGSRGLGSLAGFVLGSVGLSVLHDVRRPVVYVRDVESAGAGGAMTAGPGVAGDVVLGLDLERPAPLTLEFAFREAALRHSALRVVHAWHMPVGFGQAEIMDPGVVQEIGDRTERELLTVLAPWRERFPSVKTTAEPVMGSPAVQLVYASAAASLLVVGLLLRGHPPGGRVGPVTGAVLHHVSAPVAVVPHG